MRDLVRGESPLTLISCRRNVKQIIAVRNTSLLLLLCLSGHISDVSK